MSQVLLCRKTRFGEVRSRCGGEFIVFNELVTEFQTRFSAHRVAPVPGTVNRHLRKLVTAKYHLATMILNT
jgi:hypothetical protein